MRRSLDLGTLASLDHAEYRLLFFGMSASFFGRWMQQFAIGWLLALLAIQEGAPERAALYLGLMNLAGALPSIAAGLMAGVYADRIDRRDLLTAGRVASAVIAVVLASTVLTGSTQVVTVIILAAASTAAFAVDAPGRLAMLPSVVPARDLLSALGITRAAMQVAHAAGPLVAGVLVTPIGVGGVLVVKAGLDAASAVMLRLMKPQPIARGAATDTLFGSLREGLRHIRDDKVIRAAVNLQIVFALFGIAYVQLLPAIAVNTLHVDAVGLSWLLAAGGAGALVGALVLASGRAFGRLGAMMLVSMLLSGVLIVALGASRELVTALAILVLIGTLQQLFHGTQSVILTLVAPDRLRGRVAGFQSVVFHAAEPIGVFAIATLGAVIGLSNALVFGGLIVAAVSAIALLRMPILRDLSTGAIAEPAPLAQARAYVHAGPDD